VTGVRKTNHKSINPHQPGDFTMLTSSVPRTGPSASASSESATRDERQEQRELFISTLRIWGLTLVILVLPVLATVVLRADPTGHVRLESSEMRRAQVLAAHAARSEKVAERDDADDAERN
jgi:hypothetical protein